MAAGGSNPARVAAGWLRYALATPQRSKSLPPLTAHSQHATIMGRRPHMRCRPGRDVLPRCSPRRACCAGLSTRRVRSASWPPNTGHPAVFASGCVASLHSQLPLDAYVLATACAHAGASRLPGLTRPGSRCLTLAITTRVRLRLAPPRRFGAPSSSAGRVHRLERDRSGAPFTSRGAPS
eukprot:365558-Chlamydomonas_euryale.AAC.6